MNEAILTTSATIITGILVLASVGQALRIRFLGAFIRSIVVFGIVPFSIAAILTLLDYDCWAKIAAILAFSSLTLYLVAFTQIVSTEARKLR